MEKPSHFVGGPLVRGSSRPTPWAIHCLRSCRQPHVEFIQDASELVAKQFVGPPQATNRIERHLFQVVLLDAQAAGDVVFNRIKPATLVGGKRGTCRLLCQRAIADTVPRRSSRRGASGDFGLIACRTRAITSTRCFPLYRERSWVRSTQRIARVVRAFRVEMGSRRMVADSTSRPIP